MPIFQTVLSYITLFLVSQNYGARINDWCYYYHALNCSKLYGVNNATNADTD